MFKTFFEEPQLEVARLAAAPEGSINHSLSLLPVNIRQPLDDLMIELPRLLPEDTDTIVVVPYERYKDIPADRTIPFKRYDSTWRCIVVASDNPRYPVGGHRAAIPEAQLVRGRIIRIEQAAA